MFSGQGVTKESLNLKQFFFLMNLAFNAVMWGLFTRALTLANGTVRVSVINTSANFALSAVLGALIFREGLPAMLVAGSVIIGRRDDDKDGSAGEIAKAEPIVAVSLKEGFQDGQVARLDDAKTTGKTRMEMERTPNNDGSTGQSSLSPNFKNESLDMVSQNLRRRGIQQL
nr:hypothetical protein CFP56_25983 [Quercus suber]